MIIGTISLMNTSFESGDHHRRQDAETDTITYHMECIKRTSQMCDDDRVLNAAVISFLNITHTK